MTWWRNLPLKLKIGLALLIPTALFLLSGVITWASFWLINTELGRLSGPGVSAAELTRDVGALQTQLRWLFLGFGAFGALSLVVSLVLGGGVTLMIAKAVAELSGLAESVAEGDLTARAPVCSKDEFGQLTDTFNRMAERLAFLAGKVTRSAQEVTQTSHQLSNTSRAVADASQHVAETIGRMAHDAAEQAQAIAGSAARTATMKQEAQGVARNAESAQGAASSARDKAQSGKQVLDAATAKLEGLHDRIRASADLVQRLGTLSQQIGSFINEIKGLASQTKLLALNAAIEAANAGEHGRGFAVVADEVRQLAARSAEAAERITVMIAGIQQETAGAVTAMQLSTAEADEAMGMIGQAGQAVVQAVASVETSDREVAAISEAIRRLSEGLQHVATDMASILALASGNQAGAEDVSAATQEETALSDTVARSAEQLAEMAEDLQSVMRLFKVGQDLAEPAPTALPLALATRR